MKFESFAVTGSGKPNVKNNGNYFINGLCKEDMSGKESYDVNISWGKRDIFAVADGTGDNENSEGAALSVVSLLREFLGTDFKSAHRIFFENANAEVFGTVFKNKGKQRFVDLTTLYINKGKATAYNIGKNPVFMYSGDKLIKLSGNVPEYAEVEEIKTDEEGNEIFQTVKKETAKSLGADFERYAVSPYVSKAVKITPQSVFVLCDDKTAEKVGEKTIADILSRKKTEIDEKALKIIDIARENGMESDSTVVIVKAKRGLDFSWFRSKWFVLISLLLILGLIIASSYEKFRRIGNRVLDEYVRDEEILESRKVEPWVPRVQSDEEDELIQSENEVTETPVNEPKHPQENNHQPSSSAQQPVTPQTEEKSPSVKEQPVSPQPSVPVQTPPPVVTPPVIKQEPPITVGETETPIDLN